ncbi:MAG: protease modulator HflC [Butyrivibrio sp.]|jgi:membrane protease subunit HflC|nr:protease modulator HflC [Butyrivibrio sp.]
MKKITAFAPKVLLTIVVIGLIFIMAGPFYTVPSNQYAVIMQFGKIVRVDTTPGLKTKIPFIQSMTYIPKSVQIYDIAPSDVITKDKKSMIADDYILWEVTDPTKFVKSLNGSISGAQDRCSVAAYNATKNIISSMSQDDIIAARGEKLTDMITADTNRNIGEYGITIVMTEIKSLDLPDDNKEAVYQRMISERNNIAASYQAKGESDAQKIKNETDKEVTVMQAEAGKKAAILEAQGESEYMKTLQDAYNTEDKAAFYNYTRSLDALRNSMKGSNKTIILDKDSEIAKVLYGTGN